MLGIPTEVMVHRLGFDPGYKLIRQKLRNHSIKKLIIVKEEVKRLLDAEFVREVQYPDWLSNIVLIKKRNGNWRICVDFTNINKACPKDSFQLPRIDQLVDSTIGYKLLCFMDAYSGYNQIRMDPGDEEHTSFMTYQGTYCYKVIPFGFKNVEATYQCLVNKMFEAQIRRNVEVYVDDILVKSRNDRDHVRDLEKTFQVLRARRMKLNPTKCAFGITSEKLFDFIVSQRGIEASPEKIRAIFDMNPSWTVKEIQKLTGRLAALSRFLAKSAEKYLPFFRALRGSKASRFRWTDKCEEAFQELKIHNAKLRAYREHEGRQQHVYYMSRVLTDAKTWYPHMERIALTLIYYARKLRPYFQMHQIVVLTDQPLKSILYKPETSKRLVKWAIELDEFDPEELKLVECSRVDPECRWILHTNRQRSRSRAQNSSKIKYLVELTFPATNNVAEYEAFLAGLCFAKECSARALVVHSDSKLVEVLQVNEDDNWITPYRRYLTDGTLPTNADEAKLIKKTASWYVIIDGRLYRLGYSTPYLKCLAPEEAKYALSEIHLGIYGSHIGGKTLRSRSCGKDFSGSR
ncbi:hypothetical protein Nepgr_004456 [Nepenthes gracilis]|uniref:Reverse transcriptase domain-containing protein n=1 Tax=Nepenthes gracilis TaxID=150966 RepID=A0AAD3S1M6_NEPGR|nr:hypothetical protein Nepgr_004456 [Nepenthes gracilis]